ncbi:MAG: thioredoxin [Gemmatimonadetes bacterium]|nr:thioredoxin [Gemmatimonadota bacterium]
MNYEVSDFNEEVVERSHVIPVLVDFWAEWCGPCKMLGPVIESLAERHRDRWKLVKVNTETNRDVAMQYGIQGIPNVKLFVDGEVRDEFTGALPEPMIEQWLKKALPSPHARQLEEALRRLEDGDTENSRVLLEEVLASEPDNEQATVCLARTYLNEDPGRCLDLLKPIEPGSEFHDSAAVLQTIAGLFLYLDAPERLEEDPVKPVYCQAIEHLRREEYDLALQRFIAVLEKNRDYDDEGARRSCVAIFGMLGEGHPTTRQYRRAFSNALYA